MANFESMDSMLTSGVVTLHRGPFGGIRIGSLLGNRPGGDTRNQYIIYDIKKWVYLKTCVSSEKRLWCTWRDVFWDGGRTGRGSPRWGRSWLITIAEWRLVRGDKRRVSDGGGVGSWTVYKSKSFTNYLSGGFITTCDSRIKKDEIQGQNVTLELWYTMKTVKITKWTHIMFRFTRVLRKWDQGRCKKRGWTSRVKETRKRYERPCRWVDGNSNPHCRDLG